MICSSCGENIIIPMLVSFNGKTTIKEDAFKMAEEFFVQQNRWVYCPRCGRELTGSRPLKSLSLNERVVEAKKKFEDTIKDKFFRGKGTDCPYSPTGYHVVDSVLIPEGFCVYCGRTIY